MKIPILHNIERLIKKIRVRIKYSHVLIAQNIAFKKNFGKCKKLIVFVNFADNEFCGGVMSIFYLAEASRQMKEIHGCDVLNANFINTEGRYYLKQKRFKNNETMYRFKQIISHAKHLDTLILHVPEMMMSDFALLLTPKYRKQLKKIPNLQINVLNQNIEVFSPVETWSNLRELTDNITQTTGFDKYTNQEACDKFGLPLYRLIGYNRLHEKYTKTEIKDKEKLFLYSIDVTEQTEIILKILKEGLPDFKFQQIKGITFDEFMDLNKKALFSITFGEGFDGYFTNIHFLGGIGFTVFNETFFPSKKFLEFPNVYESYEQLGKNIVKDVKYYMENPNDYMELSEKVRALNVETAYNEKLTIDLLEKFYKKEPTFLPQK